jgi:hypothetical protein
MKTNRRKGSLVSTAGKFLACALLICACAARGQAPELTVKDAWARPPLAPQNNSAVYMIIENPTATPRSVVSVSSPDADKAELHEMRMEGNMMRMTPTKQVAVPAKGRIELKPGGFHIMLFQLKKAVKPGDRLSLVLKLDDGKSVPVTVTVRAEDANPSAAPGGGMPSMPGMK